VQCNWFLLSLLLCTFHTLQGLIHIKLKTVGNAATLKSTSRNLPNRKSLLASGRILMIPSDNNNNNNSNNNNNNFLFHV